MNQRLFQDAGGTTPAIIAGQPVGLIKRLAGSVDAVQATALSKPTLSRFPKNGMRNLANGAQAPANVAYWLDAATAVGILQEKVGSGIEGGIPYVDYRFTGTATSTAAGTFFNRTPSQRSKVAGRVSNIRATVRLIAGSLPTSPVGGRGIRVEVIESSSAGVYVTGQGASPVGAAVDTQVSMIYTETANVEGNQVRGGLSLVTMMGDVFDVTFRIKGLQWEFGDVQTPLQFNCGPNDIVEPSVADLWHLYNDGNDSLNVTLPAGTYGLASIDINRAITITTITSDGTTPINTLRHERQLDVILRAGAFSSGEETAIRDYWGRIFA